RGEIRAARGPGPQRGPAGSSAGASRFGGPRPVGPRIVSAWSGPARGPVSKSTVTLGRVAIGAVGTRTEAGQNVPHRNPQRAEASAGPSPSRNATSAVGPSPPATLEDRPTDTIRSSSPL